MTKRSGRVWAGIGAGFALALAGAAPEAEAIRSYTVQKTASAPTIDGVVGGGEWAAADAASGSFELLRQTQGTADVENNRFRALWDDQAFYLLLESDYAGWTAPPTNPNVVDFGSDNLNFYFDPNTNAGPNDDTDGDHYQIATNQWLGVSAIASGTPNGAGLFGEAGGGSIFGNNTNWAGPQGLDMAQTNGTGGVLELRIPWSDFDAAAIIGTPPTATGLFHPNAPVANEQWLFQIGRISSDASNLLPVWNWQPGQFFAEKPQGVLTFVPEPGTLFLLGSALAGLAGLRARRRR